MFHDEDEVLFSAIKRWAVMNMYNRTYMTSSDIRRICKAKCNLIPTERYCAKEEGRFYENCCVVYYCEPGSLHSYLKLQDASPSWSQLGDNYVSTEVYWFHTCTTVLCSSVPERKLLIWRQRIMRAQYFLLRFVICQKLFETARLLGLNSLHFVALYSILEQTVYSLKKQQNNY